MLNGAKKVTQFNKLVNKVINKPKQETKEELFKLLRTYSNYLSNEWNCPDIDNEIIEQFINEN